MAALGDAQAVSASARSPGPSTSDDIAEYLHEEVDRLLAAVAAEDLASFELRVGEAVESANELHRRWEKGFIVWKLPDQAPPDLDLTPR